MYKIRLIGGEEIPSPTEPGGLINAVRQSTLSREDLEMAFGHVNIRGMRYEFIEASGLKIEGEEYYLVRELRAAARREMSRYRGKNLPEAFTLSVSMTENRQCVTTP